MPICKHYPFRSLDQSVRRAKERRERGGRRYFGKYFENWIIDEVRAGLTRRVDGEPWNETCNHDLVSKYMGERPRKDAT